MEIYDINLLSDNQIDYSSLPDAILKDLTLGPDLFVANSALVTLSQRKSELALLLASDILENKLGDCYLQAVAINVLFDMDPKKALNFITRIIKTCDLYVFITILELMAENYDYFISNDVPKIIEDASKRFDELPIGIRSANLEGYQKFSSLYINPRQ